MPERRRRFVDTTEHLRSSGEQLVISTGMRSLTLESLAERGFASIGSVYERWSSRSALIDDLVERCLGPMLDQLMAKTATSLAHRLHELMETPRGERVGVWLVELLHLARDVRESAHHAQVVAQRLGDWLAVPDECAALDAADRGAQQWLLANVVGHAQLRLGGALLPPMAEAMAFLAQRPGGMSMRLVEVSVDHLPEPVAPSDEQADAIAQRLVGVTRRLIAEAGGDASIRAVLSEAGLAPGSLYRRFESKRALILEVLRHELRTTPYDWVQGLLDATSSADPVGALAAVFARRFDNLATDVDTRNVILELTAQARTDEALRRMVMSQVEQVARIRAAFFARFAASGLLTGDVSPEVCGWLVQCPAAGYRLMMGAGLQPSSDEVEAAVARVFWNLLSP